MDNFATDRNLLKAEEEVVHHMVNCATQVVVSWLFTVEHGARNELLQWLTESSQRSQDATQYSHHFGK